ncbi:MAG: DUF3859 domain-containing protein [Rhodobacteraceae bacterium]|nr:DUF3859 domain-containing protein [Paracoccaceae bacterium]
MLRWLVTFCFAFAAGLAQAAPQRQGAAELLYGYFCALEPVSSEQAAGTVSGVVLLVDSLPSFISQGPVVPAQIGVGFGVHVRVLPEYEGQVTVQVEHPPMGPNGVTRENWNTRLSSDDLTYSGFSFEEDYELLPGTWTMSAHASGRPIYSVSFEVVIPAVLPPVDCSRYVPLS